MKLLHFVTGSSLVLAAWLAATFVYHVPAQRYLKLEKYPTTAAAAKPAAADPALASVGASAGIAVSTSR